jgi:predicted enzyme related to lactoylglutathione lyase
MPSVTYADGVPCWVDLSTTDVDAAAAFYGALFGWEAVAAGPPEETGGYRLFMKDGRSVGGVMRAMQPGQPVAWSTYFWADDLDATAAKVRDAGGQVIVEPMDVTSAGRMGFFVDPTGAAFGAWQPGDNRGAQVVNEPGALVWNELQTRGIEQAKPFYAAVFGLEGHTSDMGPMRYTEWKLGDRTVGGGMDFPPDVPPQVPPFWQVYFGVEDTDAALARITELGGSVVMEPIDIPAGRFAMAADPQGGNFAVIALAS